MNTLITEEDEDEYEFNRGKQKRQTIHGTLFKADEGSSGNVEKRKSFISPAGSKTV